MLMKRLQKSLITTLILGLGSTGHSETLTDVIHQAVRQSPDVREIINQKRSRSFDVRAAEAGHLPTLDLNAGYGYEYTDSPTTRPKDDEELDRGEFGLTLRQKIYDGLATDAEVERQKARLETAEHLLQGVINDTALAVTENFLNVQRYRNILALANDNRDVHLKIQDQIRLRSQAGVGRGADYDQINARVSLVEANLVAASVNLQDAETAYKRVVGQEPARQLDGAPKVSSLLPATLEEALVLAEAGNYTYRSSATDVMQAQAQHKAARSSNYPNIDFELSSNLNNDLDGTDGYNNDVTAMLRLRYNLYNGGGDQARIASASSKVQEAHEIRHRSYRQLEETLRLAWAAYAATSRQIELLQKQVDYSVATRDAYVKQFNIGQRTLLDLLNTENELFQAKQSLVNARNDNVFAQFRILAVMGRMAEATNIDVAALLAADE